MQQDTLKDIIEGAMGKAREMILADKEVLRAFFVVDKENRSSVIMAPSVGSIEDDTQLIPYLRMLFAILGVESYCMMSEVWMSKRATREGPPPSQDPNRTEALIAFAVQRAKDHQNGKLETVTRFASAEITRDPTAVGPVKWEDLMEIESKWSTLLPPEGMPECPDVPWALNKLAEVGKIMGIGQFDCSRDPSAKVH